MAENKKTLAAIVQYSTEVIQQLASNGGELTPELEDALEQVEKDLVGKADAYIYLLDRLAMEEAFFKQKAEDFAIMKRAVANLQTKLKDRIKHAMLTLKRDEIKGNDYRFKLQRIKPKLEINPDLLPEDFKTQVISYQPNKDMIQALLDAGEQVPGAEFKESYALKKYVSRGGES